MIKETATSLPSLELDLWELVLVICFLSSLFMDFLKSAVASAIAKSSSFPYAIGDRVDNNESIWTQHNGTKKVCTMNPGPNQC